MTVAVNGESRAGVFLTAANADRLEAVFHDDGVDFPGTVRMELPPLDDLKNLPEGGFGLF